MSGIKVVVDYREGKLKDIITEEYINKYNIHYENLEHGDIVVYYNDSVILVFERKTIQDLIASIHDGRYRNQKLKLLETYDRTSIYYIIEGNTSKANDISVKGAIINTMIRDKICVFTTKDLKDTLDLIYNIVERIMKDPSKYFVNKDEQHTIVSKNESTFINMLCQIPHISLKTAKAIAEEYTSSHDLTAKLSNKPYIEKLNSLKDILTFDSKGKGRKISKTACENIVKEYFGNGEGESPTLQ